MGGGWTVRFPDGREEASLDANKRIAFEEGGKTSRATWLRIRRWHVVTSVVLWISWLVGVVLMLVGGGIVPSLDDRVDDAAVGVRKRRSGAHPAWLVLHRTTGWPRDWQVDFEKSFAAKWRGTSAMASGRSWAGNGALTWTPNRTWTRLGARGFMLQLESTMVVERTQLSHRSVGLIIRQSDGAEVWLWFRGQNSLRVSEALRTFASQAG